MKDIIIDKDYKVYVKVDYKVHKFFRKLKVDSYGLKDDIAMHLLFLQYKPWDDRELFVKFVKEMISKWSIKKNYGKLEIKCFKEDAPINDNGMTYTFKVNLGINEECVVFVDVIVNYRSTWMQNRIMKCDESIKELVESILFTNKKNKKLDIWMNDIKYSMEYIPGCTCRKCETGFDDYVFIKGNIYFVLNEKNNEAYLVDYRNGVNDGHGYVYGIGDNVKIRTDVYSFLNTVKLENFSLYTFMDDYFGNMFIDIYKNGKKEK